MIRLLLSLQAFLLMSRKDPVRRVIFRILWSKKYPVYRYCNTRRFVYTCLEYKRKNGDLSTLQKASLGRIANG